MSFLEDLQIILTRPWMGIYLRILAVIMLYGGWVHISSILGLSGEPWKKMPLLWRILDVVLLIFNIVVAVGLWQKTLWSIFLFLSGMLLLQFIPYTVFRHHFAKTDEERKTLNGLLGTEAILIFILAILYMIGK